MSQRVDFKAIRAQVSMRQVLDYYGLLDKLKQKSNNLVGPCPLHNGTNPLQFSVSLTKNLFNCFGDCGGGGNVIDFIAKMEGITIRQAALNLQEWFGIGDGENASNRKPVATKETSRKTAGVREEHESRPPLTESDAAPQDTPAEERAKEKKDGVANKPLSFVLKHLDPDHPYLAKRGLTKETITEFGLGYCAKGIMKARVAIPICEERADLVAYAGRWPGDPPDGEGKYKLPVGFHKSLVVFNLHRAKEYASAHGLVLVEGFFDCLHLWQAGVRNVVALMGSSLSPEQEALIVQAVGPQGRVALMFNEDEAGWKCREDALSRLSSQVYVKVIGLGEEGRQPDSLTVEELRSLGLL